MLGEIDIDVNNRTDQYLYTENYIFNTDVTDADIKENKSPDLYYQNRYFSQPNLKSSPYEYTLKNQDHVVYLEDGNF